MKVFIAGILTETNTFAPTPTGMQAFEEGGILRGDSLDADANLDADAPLATRWPACADCARPKATNSLRV